jgi:predicted permease
MLLRLISIVAPVFASAAIGYAWARSGRPFDTPFVTRMIMNVGAPCLIVSSFADAAAFDRGALGTVGLAALLVLACVSAIAWLVIRLFRLEVRAFHNSIVFPNTGNMGIPLCLFAFGGEGLSLGVLVFLVVSTMHFTAGVAVVSGERSIRSVLRMPLLWASAIAVTLVVSGWNLPAWIANTVDIMGGLTIPLMLLSLGVTLSTLRVETLGRSFLFAMFRLGLGFGVGLAVASILGLDGIARGVVVLQASMPSAVFNYLMAERYGRRPADVAGIVVMTTILSFVTIPAVLWFLIR